MEIMSKKWDSIQEIKNLKLKCNATEIFTKDDGIDKVLDSVISMNLLCGLRTDLSTQSYFYPFYLPDRRDIYSGKVTVDDFRNSIIDIWSKDPNFYIIVSSSPNLVEDQMWDAVVFLTEFRSMFGDIHVGVCNSLRYAWRNMQLSHFENEDIWNFKYLPKVRGDLIRRKIFNRRVEVSAFPNLGLYYWEVGDIDKCITSNPPCCWNQNLQIKFRHVRDYNGMCVCHDNDIAELLYDEENNFFFIDNANFDVVDEYCVCPKCRKISRNQNS